MAEEVPQFARGAFDDTGTDPLTRARQKLSAAHGLSANGLTADARAEIREAMQLLDAAAEVRDDA
jgi:hypothetical protein